VETLEVISEAFKTPASSSHAVLVSPKDEYSRSSTIIPRTTLFFINS